MKDDYVHHYFRRESVVANSIICNDNFLSKIDAAAALLIEALSNKHKIFSCGNGGSMCDAVHFASELTGKYNKERQPLAAIALSDTAAMSCISNDFNYSHVFYRQIKALGTRGDVLIAISTSGNSQNVINAMIAAEEVGMRVIGLTGDLPSPAFIKKCSVTIPVPSLQTNHIQEQHIKILHLLVELIERKIVYDHD